MNAFPWRQVFLGPMGFALYAVIVAAVVYAVVMRRRGWRGGRLAAAGTTVFAGLFLVVFMSLHTTLISVLAVRTALGKAPPEGESSMPYNFRTYALLFFGIFLLTRGLAILRTANGVARGERPARRRALGVSLLVLAMNLPLLPIQPNAAFAVGVFAVHLATLAVTWRSFAAAATARPVVVGDNDDDRPRRRDAIDVGGAPGMPLVVAAGHFGSN